MTAKHGSIMVAHWIRMTSNMVLACGPTSPTFNNLRWWIVKPPTLHRSTPSPHTKPSPPSTITATPSPQTPSSIPPVNHATLQKPMPTNKEILSDPYLFLLHITDIDHALNSFPNPNSMTPTPQLAQGPNPKTLALSNAPKSTIPHKESSNFEETFHRHNQHTIIVPKSPDSQHDASTSTHLSTTKTVGLKNATWRRLGPPTPYVMEASIEPILGPKCKSQVLDTQNTIFI